MALRCYTTVAIDCDYCEHETFFDCVALAPPTAMHLARVHGWIDQDGGWYCPECAAKYGLQPATKTKRC
jgi:hypothetical protein